jgi:hypothetical protein
MIPFHVPRLKHVSSCTHSHLFFLSLRATQFCFSQKSPIPSANDIIILILNGRGNKRKKASDYKMVDLLVMGVGVGWGGTAGCRGHEDISFTSHRYYWRVTVQIYVTRKHAGSLTNEWVGFPLIFFCRYCYNKISTWDAKRHRYYCTLLVPKWRHLKLHLLFICCIHTAQ